MTIRLLLIDVAVCAYFAWGAREVLAFRVHRRTQPKVATAPLVFAYAMLIVAWPVTYLVFAIRHSRFVRAVAWMGIAAQAGRLMAFAERRSQAIMSPEELQREVWP